ncbi:MAG: hypothetical protein P8Y05_04135, partial [Deinococcales bacterium]
PHRPPTPLAPLPLQGRWDFAAPDLERFPSLPLAYRAGELGGVAPAYLNAADEIAVARFLAGRVRFTDIPRLLEYVLAQAPREPLGWDALLAGDREARELAGAWRASA